MTTITLTSSRISTPRAGALFMILSAGLVLGLAGDSRARGADADWDVKDHGGHALNGDVFGPGAKVNGYSLADAARATAVYNTGGATLPKLPFQFVNSDATVKAGQPLYFPIFFADDSPPIALAPFPHDLGNDDAVDEYLVQAIDQFTGLADVEATFIDVDGNVTILGDDYTVGVKTAPLADGGGTHYILSAAFVEPLSPGEHSVSIGAVLTDGTQIGPPGYTIIVK